MKAVGLERHLLAKKVSKMVLPHVDSSEHGHCEEKGGRERGPVGAWLPLPSGRRARRIERADTIRHTPLRAASTAAGREGQGADAVTGPLSSLLSFFLFCPCSFCLSRSLARSPARLLPPSVWVWRDGRL